VHQVRDDGFRAVTFATTCGWNEFGPLGQVPVARCGQARAEGALAVSAEGSSQDGMLRRGCVPACPGTQYPSEQRNRQMWSVAFHNGGDEQVVLWIGSILSTLWPPS